VTGIRENLSELPDVIDLAARIGVAEAYLQRMVFGFSGDGVDKTLARADESIYDQRYRAQAEAFIEEAERRANAHGIRFRGADALSPRESIVDRPPIAEPWRLQPPAAAGVCNGSGHSAAVLHRAVYRRTLREHCAGQLPAGRCAVGLDRRGVPRLPRAPVLIGSACGMSKLWSFLEPVIDACSTSRLG
jgi:hypothetical protein